MKNRFVYLFLFIFSTAYGDYVDENNLTPHPHKATVLGTGYVGLVLGAGLSEMGHTVLCADIDKDKIEILKNGDVPIYEAGLKEVIDKNVKAQRLNFTDNISKAIQENDLIFIAVGTPSSADGQVDLTFIKSVAEAIGRNLNRPKIVCMKSTVPIGCGKNVIEWIRKEAGDNAKFDYVFNPEFLREGTALHDHFEPDRVILGTDSENAKQVMDEVYWHYHERKVPFLYTDKETAEAIKYASNSFLAVKITFINEFANLCDALGADIEVVAKGMGMDDRIGPKFLKAGPGFGGSCFPKDTLGLLWMAKEAGVDMKIVQAAVEANDAQRDVVVQKLQNLLDNDLKAKTIGILGMAFKANTDDVRYSPAIAIIEKIKNAGGHVKAYDPAAMLNMRKVFPDIEYADSLYEVSDGADAIVVLTEWSEFKTMDLMKLRGLMKQPILLDTRNIIDALKLKELGFRYGNIGRPNKL